MRNLRKISRDLGENLSDEELQAMIDEFDLDEDGESMYYIYKANLFRILVLAMFEWKITNFILFLVNEEEFIRICTE